MGKMMRTRVTVSCASAVVAALALAAEVPSAAAQARAAPDPGYRAPRTADGQPDISGIWRNDTLTPLERPARLGDRAFHTEVSGDSENCPPGDIEN